MPRACIQAHNRINEFGELSLSNKEAQEDVAKWFEKHPGHVARRKQKMKFNSQQRYRKVMISSLFLWDFTDRFFWGGVLRLNLHIETGNFTRSHLFVDEPNPPIHQLWSMA